MSAAVPHGWLRAKPQQQRYDLEAARAGCEMQECSSGKTPCCERGGTLHDIQHKVNQPGATGLDHARQQPDEHHRPGHKPPCENYCLLIAAARNCSDCVI